MGPVNELEMFFVNILLMLSLMFSVNLFGQVAVHIANMNKLKTINQVKVDSSNSVMANINITSETAESIRKYLRKTQDSKDR